MAKKRNILLVDDTPDILEALEVVLSMEGYIIDKALNHNEVKGKMKDSSHLPDLILLDVLLSGQDGRVIAHELKTNPTTKHIPIIMMSAHPNVSKSIKETGADDFIPKPFEMDDLLSKIKKYLK